MVCGEVEPGAVEGAMAVYGYGVGAGGGNVVERGEGRGNGGGVVVEEDYRGFVRARLDDGGGEEEGYERQMDREEEGVSWYHLIEMYGA